MKYILLTILMGCVTTLFAQSNADFEKGKELYSDSQYKEALVYLQPAAKSGNPEAQHLVGWCYMWTDTNVTIATNLWQRAASQNYAPAFVSLGMLYEHGRFIKKEIKKALFYYQKASELGDMDGSYNLSRLYLQGTEIPKDEAKAFQLCQKAAPFVDRASDALGNMYYDGIGTSIDHKAALSAFEQSGSLSFKDSLTLIRMATLYFEGKVTQADPIRAATIINEMVENKSLTPPLATVSSIRAAAQTAQDEIDFDTKSEVVKETPCEFPGGLLALNKFIADHIVYPKEAVKNGIQGRVIIQITIDEQGRVTNPQIVHSVDKSLDNEALRLVKSMPNWIPGFQIKRYKNREKQVMFRVKHTIPIAFALN